MTTNDKAISCLLNHMINEFFFFDEACEKAGLSIDLNELVNIKVTFDLEHEND